MSKNIVILNDPILNGSKCPYCGNKSKLVDSYVIYGRSYGLIYLCKPCDAYCGVHKGTEISLGRLANKELRNFKKAAHLHFDPIWKDNIMSRKEAYEKLSYFMNIDNDLTHIGMFDEQQCKQVIEFSKEYLKYD